MKDPRWLGPVDPCGDGDNTCTEVRQGMLDFCMGIQGNNEGLDAIAYLTENFDITEHTLEKLLCGATEKAIESGAMMLKGTGMGINCAQLTLIVLLGIWLQQRKANAVKESLELEDMLDIS